MAGTDDQATKRAKLQEALDETKRTIKGSPDCRVDGCFHGRGWIGEAWLLDENGEPYPFLQLCRCARTVKSDLEIFQESVGKVNEALITLAGGLDQNLNTINNRIDERQLEFQHALFNNSIMLDRHTFWGGIFHVCRRIKSFFQKEFILKKFDVQELSSRAMPADEAAKAQQ